MSDFFVGYIKIMSRLKGVYKNEKVLFENNVNANMCDYTV